MASVNKVILVGRLGKDPEVRYGTNGNCIANFNMATSRIYTNKEKQKVDETEWHRVVAFGRTGEVCAEYLHKGSLIYLEGRLKTRDWEDKDGNKRWTTEVIIDNMQMMDKKPSDAGDAGGTRQGNFPEGTGTDIPDDDVPF